MDVQFSWVAAQWTRSDFEPAVYIHMALAVPSVPSCL